MLLYEEFTIIITTAKQHNLYLYTHKWYYIHKHTHTNKRMCQVQGIRMNPPTEYGQKLPKTKYCKRDKKAIAFAPLPHSNLSSVHRRYNFNVICYFITSTQVRRSAIGIVDYNKSDDDDNKRRAHNT